MDVVYPPTRDTQRLVKSFSAGCSAFRTGQPRTVNPHPFGTDDHARWLAGWNVAQNVADGEAEDVMREMAEDARASEFAGVRAVLLDAWTSEDIVVVGTSGATRA